LSGLLFEAVQARVEGRHPLDLYHAALEIHLGERRFVIEMSSIPDGEGAARGVVGEGPIASRHVPHVRILRYELRCWQGGIVAELNHAVACLQHLGADSRQAYRLLELVRLVPRLTWGRDELGVGEMWNSNSVIAWLLARAGLPTEGIRPPAGGRAPGWAAGLAVAAQQSGAHDGESRPRAAGGRSRRARTSACMAGRRPTPTNALHPQTAHS